MWIDGGVVNALTFPGVFIHQGFYWLAARASGVEVAFSPREFTQSLSNRIALIGESDSMRIGKRLSRQAALLSGIACALLSALNEFTAPASLVELVVVWVAISTGMHGFPFASDSGPRWGRFLWLDAIYAALVYAVGKLAVLSALLLLR